MSFTVESKSQLAKLMATENLTVVHQKLSTAMFDVQNRTLYLPIWQDMSGFLYDLFTGHEVGHALYTPEEGLHTAIVLENKGRHYKAFLNVVEDARIEKKIKRRYPGLKSSFRKAYAELLERDFFGLRGRDVDNLPFIDRLNIHTKTQMYVEFSDEEQSFVDRAFELETWDDVVKLADEIYAYSKVEQQGLFETPDALPEKDDYGQPDGDPDFGGDSDYSLPSDDGDSNSDEPGDESGDESEFGESGDADDTGEQNESGENAESGTKSDEEDGQGEDGDGEGSGESDADEQVEGKGTNNSVADEKDTAADASEGDTDGDPDFEPSCETDDNFRQNERGFVDPRCREYKYIAVPKVDVKKVWTPYARVQEQMNACWGPDGIFPVSRDRAQTLVSKFKHKNDRFVAMLAKEFEMKKAAKSFAKAKIADSGDINLGKLAGYKFDENIFRKVTRVPKGKSHGLILLLDGSGSMRNNMPGSIEQILVLTMFCRKVNIPFRVFSFNNKSAVIAGDRKQNPNDVVAGINEKAFSYDEGEFRTSDMVLREYLSSDMSTQEFNSAFQNMILLKEAFEYCSPIHLPYSEGLSNTPLNEAIIALQPIMLDFKKSKGLDMTNLVVVHDGDADSIKGAIINGQESYIDSDNQNVFFNDTKRKYQAKVKSKHKYAITQNQAFTHVVYDWFKATTGSKIVGFYIVPTRDIKNTLINNYRFDDLNTLKGRMYDSNGAIRWSDTNLAAQELVKKMRKDNYLATQYPGADAFYMILGGTDMVGSDNEIQIDGKVTASKLKNAFIKMNQKRVVSRVLVSKFIEKIAV